MPTTIAARHRFGFPMRGVVACWVLLATALGAQEEAPGVFGEVLDVRVVNVEVVVTDRQGARVSGLAAEDLILEVDGREVPIEYFSEVRGGTSVPPDAADYAVPALAPGEPVGTSYLLFVDDFFTLAARRDRILESVIEDLPVLGPEDRMAIVAYDGRGIDMLSTWSDNPAALERALEAAMKRPAFGLQREGEQRTFEASAGIRDPEVLSTEFGDRLDLDEERRIQLVADQVRRVVLAGAAALRGFANPPGRKVMLLLSGGWPWNPAEWVVGDPSRSAFLRTVETGERLYRPLIETANRLGYTLYPADVPGLVGEDVEITSARVTDVSLQQRAAVDREQEVEATLSILAERTGGRAMIDGTARDLLPRVAEDTRTYYWLGFTPDWKGNDTDHTIEVRSRREGLKVRAREGFSDLSRSNEVSMMVESTLLFGNAPSAAPLEVRLGEPEKSGWKKVRVPFEVLVPLEELTFLPEAGGEVAQAELRIAVLDEDGATADIPVIPLSLRTGDGASKAGAARYANEVEMRRKRHEMVFSVYDRASGKILSRRLVVGEDW